eukprot:5711410-Alexandrium_andersonii.AAC.1
MVSAAVRRVWRGASPSLSSRAHQRIQKKQRRTGEQNDPEKAILRRSEDASSAVGGGNGPSDQLLFPLAELGSFDRASKRAECPDRE